MNLCLKFNASYIRGQVWSPCSTVLSTKRDSSVVDRLLVTGSEPAPAFKFLFCCYIYLILPLRRPNDLCIPEPNKNSESVEVVSCDLGHPNLIRGLGIAETAEMVLHDPENPNKIPKHAEVVSCDLRLGIGEMAVSARVSLSDMHALLRRIISMTKMTNIYSPISLLKFGWSHEHDWT